MARETVESAQHLSYELYFQARKLTLHVQFLDFTSVNCRTINRI